MTRDILIVGATGQQGRATIDAVYKTLKASPQQHQEIRLLALTRSANGIQGSWPVWRWQIRQVLLLQQARDAQPFYIRFYDLRSQSTEIRNEELFYQKKEWRTITGNEVINTSIVMLEQDSWLNPHASPLQEPLMICGTFKDWLGGEQEVTSDSQVFNNLEFCKLSQ